MNDVINRNAAIEMVEKIIDEMSRTDMGIDEMKLWARKMMETILPVEETEND